MDDSEKQAAQGQAASGRTLRGALSRPQSERAVWQDKGEQRRHESGCLLGTREEAVARLGHSSQESRIRATWLMKGNLD